MDIEGQTSFHFGAFLQFWVSASVDENPCSEMGRQHWSENSIFPHHSRSGSSCACATERTGIRIRTTGGGLLFKYSGLHSMRSLRSLRRARLAELPMFPTAQLGEEFASCGSTLWRPWRLPSCSQWQHLHVLKVARATDAACTCASNGCMC